VGETAREFARRAGLAPWAAPLALLTAAYERVRFGGAVLDPAERDDLEAALRDLAAAARARRPG
jgi:hypothetical protein